jgi:hypothetical protein
VLDDRALAALRGHERELDQIMALLAAAGHDVANLPVGAGDRRLLGLYQEITGHGLELTVACAACGSDSVVTLAPESLIQHRPRCAPCGPGGGLREPTYGDLAGLPAAADEAAAELLRRCTVGVPTRPVAAEDLDRVDDSLCGPMALACSGCGTAMTIPVDLQRLVLAELFLVLDRLDVDVHLLARAYQWSLETIESLPPERRRRLAWLVEEGW